MNLMQSKLRQATQEKSDHPISDAGQDVQGEHGPKQGAGEEITIRRNPDGSAHTEAKKHDGTMDVQDHASIEEAMQHAHGHFGHAKPMREKNPKMREREQAPAEESGGDQSAESMLSAMGVDSGE